jgi:hypothetical protein
MTTPAALAQARLDQALVDLQAAERVLLAVMAGIAPIPAIGIVDGILPRRFESLLEGTNPHRELAAAWSAYRRAQRAEVKAQLAAIRAQAAPAPAPTPVPKPARRARQAKTEAKTTFAAYIEARAA